MTIAARQAGERELQPYDFPHMLDDINDFVAACAKHRQAFPYGRFDQLSDARGVRSSVAAPAHRPRKLDT